MFLYFFSQLAVFCNVRMQLNFSGQVFNGFSDIQDVIFRTFRRLHRSAQFRGCVLKFFRPFCAGPQRFDFGLVVLDGARQRSNFRL